MRGPLAWIAAIAVGLVVLVGVVALVGRSDDSGETVSAAEWADRTCGAVATWRGQMEAIVEDIRTPTSAGTGSEEPQSETPQGRTGFVRQGLERAIGATETLVTAIENTGTPDTPEGDDAANRVANWADTALAGLEDAEDSLDEEADSLEESLEQLANAVRAVGSTLTTGAQTIVDVARLDEELGAALRDSAVCQGLRDQGEDDA